MNYLKDLFRKLIPMFEKKFKKFQIILRICFESFFFILWFWLPVQQIDNLKIRFFQIWCQKRYMRYKNLSHIHSYVWEMYVFYIKSYYHSKLFISCVFVKKLEL